MWKASRPSLGSCQTIPLSLWTEPVDEEVGKWVQRVNVGVLWT